MPLRQLGVRIGRSPLSDQVMQPPRGLADAVMQDVGGAATDIADLFRDSPINRAMREGRVTNAMTPQRAIDTVLSVAPLGIGAIAFHGSPHKFDKFSMEKIGTGEGAQAYGHGLYFAENPRVAKQHQKDISQKDLIRKWRQDLPDDASFEEVTQMAKDGAFGESGKAFIAALKADDWLGFDYPAQAVSAALHPKATQQFDMSPLLLKMRERLGYNYKVDIPDEAVGKMLDWDKPLSQQPESVRKALSLELESRIPKFEAEYRSRGVPEARIKEITAATRSDLFNGTGAGYIEALGKGKDASEFLKSIGIPGIKYLDQGSRAAGEGTRNFVLFDDALVKILERK